HTWSVTCLRAGIISTRSSSSCSRSSGCCSHSDCSFLGALAADENCSGFGSAACQCQRLLQLHGASLLPASLRLVLAQLRSRLSSRVPFQHAPKARRRTAADPFPQAF